MIIEGKIENIQYENLIKYACSKCDAVMFISRKDGFNNEEIKELDKTIEKIKKEFKNSFIKSRNGAHWVFSKVGYEQLGYPNKDPHNFNQLFEVLFYKTDKDIERYLLSNRNLYAWLNPKYPEDIAFFKNGICWLYSVAHEKICCIYYENEDEYEFLKSIGIKFENNRFEHISKDELYYEEY